MTDMTDINTGQSPQSPGVVSVVSVVSNISKPPARASDNEPDDHGPPQSAGGNPELGRIIQDLGGYCPGCGGFICECDPAP
jgi:hypothetical protein